MPASQYDVIVIGEGVAGLTAANALAKTGMKTATLEAQLFGGLIINVNELDPAPEGRQVGGAEFASELMQLNQDLGVTSIPEPVTAIEASGAMKRVVTAGGSYGARHVVVASGARLRKLGVPGEAEYEGRGVSQCADCDGPMYQNETVVVVGGGDSALQEAIVLTHYCGKVQLVHRGSQFRARPHFIEQVKRNGKITTVWNAQLAEVAGGKMVERARIRHADGRTEDIPCAGVFAYIGLEPNADFLSPEYARDSNGFLVTNGNLETSVPGVWAAGAVRSGCGGLISDAIGEAQRVAAAIRR
ncbi:MAG: NAD(P)/FAD-dependent oxidoreductase [Betaproteobacteria bacterium]|nr:NAD(P)/FAD-dependent oxidoreductase [Betaproteobacteria bacterium]